MIKPDYPNNGPAAALASLALLTVAYGQTPVTITNPSFDDDVLAESYKDTWEATGVPTGWSGGYTAATDAPAYSVWTEDSGGSGFSGALNPDAADDYGGVVPDGSNIAYAVTDSGFRDGLRQVLGETVQANATYDLSVEVGNPDVSPGGAGYVIEMVADGTVLASATGAAPASGTFVTVPVSYTAPASGPEIGQAIEIRLLTADSGPDSLEVNFDDVSLTKSLADPVADAGGPYIIISGDSLSLDGSASIPSDGETITLYEWDIDNDGNYDLTGATPAAITYADLQTTYGMTLGDNTIQLRVTDSSSDTSVAPGTVTLVTTLIYEGFDYAGSNIGSQSGGTGFSADWAATRGNPSVQAGSKIYGALETSGGFIRGAAWSGCSREIGTTLSDAGLMDDGATLWFSIVFDLAAQNLSNADLNMALCSDRFHPGAFGDRENLDSGEGIGIGHSGGTIQGVWWKDNDADTIAERNENSSSISVTSTSGPRLIVGKIEWGGDGTADEKLTLYGPATDLTLGSPVMAEWSIPALDQSLFDRISLQFKDTSQMDEIRFAGTAEGVLPEDIDPPVLVSVSPADEADGAPSSAVPVATTLGITYNRDVQLGTGNITLFETGVGQVEVFDVATSTSVSVSGDTVLVEPSSFLAYETAYHVEVDASAVTSLAGIPTTVGISGMADPNWNFTTDVAPVVEPAGPGALTVYGLLGGGEAITTAEFNHSFDEVVRLSESQVLTPSGFEMDAGHHLVIYNSRFDTSSSSNRSEVQSNLNLAGTDLAAGWSQGYIRRDSGADECITAGGAIINVAANDDLLQLQSFRTDSNTGAGVIREPGATGIQLLKLDDSWDYLSLVGGSDQSIPDDSVNFTAVTYDTEVEKDTGSFTFTPGGSAVTLGPAGHYMVFANTYASGATNRRAIIQRLALDGTEIPGSRTMVYLRSNESTQEGAVSIGMIIETTAPGEVLTVEMTHAASQAGMTTIGARTALTIAKLPDSADYIRLENSAAQANNPGTPAPLGYDTQLELDSAFSHDTVTDNGRITVNSDGDFLFLANQFDGNNEVQRVVSNQGWSVNGGGLEGYGQTASYGRDLGGVEVSGNWSGFISGLSTSDYVESVVVELAASGGNTADTTILQGVELESLFTVLPPGGNDYSDWIATFPGVGGETGFEDDPDDDGKKNGLENYLGTDPTVSSGGLVAAAYDDVAGIFTFSHPLSDDPADDITATYQWSTDLSGFTPDGVASGGTTVTFSQSAPVDGVVTVTATVTGTQVDKLFARILVELNP